MQQPVPALPPWQEGKAEAGRYTKTENAVAGWKSTGGYGMLAAVSTGDAQQFAIELARIAHDLKSEEVVALDLRGLSQVMDYVVICTGTSDRQMRGAADRMIEYGRRIGERPYGFCGYDSACWVVIDFVDVVVHLFARPYRTYYDLELLWGHAPKLDWPRSESA